MEIIQPRVSSVPLSLSCILLFCPTGPLGPRPHCCVCNPSTLHLKPTNAALHLGKLTHHRLVCDYSWYEYESFAICKNKGSRLQLRKPIQKNGAHRDFTLKCLIRQKTLLLNVFRIWIPVHMAKNSPGRWIRSTTFPVVNSMGASHGYYPQPTMSPFSMN